LGPVGQCWDWAELLGYLRGQQLSEMKLCVTLLLLVPLVSSTPVLQSIRSSSPSSSSILPPSSSWTSWLNVVSDYLPTKVNNYLNETISEGVKVLEVLIEETRQDALEKSSIRVDEFTDILEKFIGKLEEIYRSASQVVEQRSPLSDPQIIARNTAGDLEGTKEKIDSLETELDKERSENYELEGLERQLQSMITTARGLLSSADNQAELVWSKLKQLELEFYQASQLVASTSGEIRQQLTKAFGTLHQDLQDSSPGLKKLLDIINPGLVEDEVMDSPRAEMTRSIVSSRVSVSSSRS